VKGINIAKRFNNTTSVPITELKTSEAMITNIAKTSTTTFLPITPKQSSPPSPLPFEATVDDVDDNLSE
jgi:hypothetical protein